MSASQGDSDQQAQFGTSFAALVDFLRKRFQDTGAVSLPSNIIAPFRKAFHPIDGSLLRGLSKVLDSGRPHKNVARLDSSASYYIVAIVLQFPYSVVQSKLLYLFMDTIRQYKHENTFRSVLSGIYGKDVTAAEVKDQADYLGRKLSQCTLSHLVTSGRESRLRWNLAQFLSVLLRVSSAARDHVLGMKECELLRTILSRGDDHVLRILIADIVRELLSSGAELKTFGSSPKSQKTMEDFPVSQDADAKWMSQIIAHVAQIDAVRGSGGRNITEVLCLECDDTVFFDGSMLLAVMVAEEILFLLPGNDAMLTLVSIPISTNMSTEHFTSESDSVQKLGIRYTGDEADRFVNGSRSAISSVTITFSDQEALGFFKQAIEDGYNSAASEKATKTPVIPRKHSIAMIDIGSSSGDHNRAQKLVLDAENTSHVQTVSPLRDVPLRARHKKGPQAAVLAQKQDRVTLAPSDSEMETETPALRKPPDSRPLIDRLRASSQQEGTHPKADARAAATQLPAGKSNTSRSNQAKKRSKPIDTTEHASTNGTMAKITGKSTTAGLKRRPDKLIEREQIQSQQKPSKHAQDSFEFDLLPSDEDDARPAKKVKTKPGKTVAKATSRESALKKNETVQVQASPKVKNKTQRNQGKSKKPAERPEKTTTIASTRSKRPAKTPKYIENSDDSGGEEVEDGAHEQEDVSDRDVADEEEETAEDSYPLDKEVLAAAMQSTQNEFESQLLPEMVDKETTDDEERVGNKSASTTTTTEIAATAIKAMELQADKQLTAQSGPPPLTKPANRARSKAPIDKVLQEVLAPIEPSHRTSKKHDITTKKSHDSTLVLEPTGVKLQNIQSEHLMDTATPRGMTKRLSETSIPPASEKLLRKTPIVHFGPQGPANQAVSSKIATKEVTFTDAPSENFVPSEVLESANDSADLMDMEDAVEHERSPTLDLQIFDTSAVVPTDVSKDADAGHTRGVSLRTDEIAHSSASGDEPALSRDLQQETKSPEIEETQPRGASTDDNAEDNTSEYPSGDDEAEDADAASSKDRSYEQEVSEYVASDAGEEEDIHSPEIPQARALVKSRSTTFRPQTPLLDEHEPKPSKQQAVAPSNLQQPTRPSIGVNDLLNNEYPTTSKTISTEKFRAKHQSDVASYTSMHNDKSVLLGLPSSKLHKPLVRGTDDDRAEDAQRTRASSIVPSILKARAPATLVNAAALPSRNIQAEKEHAKVVVRAADLAPVKIVQAGTEHSILRSKRSDMVQDLNRMAVKPLPTSKTQPMAPPPLPKSSNASSRHDLPRRSWPESRMERSSKLTKTFEEAQHFPIHAGPVRVNKRHTLPSATVEQPQELKLAPGTPVSFATRLGLPTGPETHQGDQDEDSIMRDASHKVGNGSTTLMDDDESMLGEELETETAQARQHSNFADDMSVDESPSDGHGRSGERSKYEMTKVDGRETQQGLMAAIISITNDVLFRFGDEEDALRAKVDAYSRGGTATVEDFKETWGQKIVHERNIVGQSVVTEEKVLAKYTKALSGKDAGSWRVMLDNEGLLADVQKKGASLVKKIEAFAK